MFTVEVYRGALVRAITDGRLREPGSFPVAHYHGDCMSPVQVGLIARHSAVVPVRSKHGDFNARPAADALVRCRNCPACVKHRKRLWTARALDECIGAPRTWFVTLTLTPEWQARITILAARKDRRFDILTDGEQFALRAEVIGPELTKYLKRVRVGASRRQAAKGRVPPKMRYMAVFEAHKSGLPHIHLLVHEVVGHGPVTYDDLVESWPHGFAHAKLIDDPIKSARYVAKYITKATHTRIRASVRYGSDTAPPGADAQPPPREAEGSRVCAGARARALSCACAPAHACGSEAHRGGDHSL